MKTIVLSRVTSQRRTSDEKIRKQLDYIIGRGLASSRGKTWTSEINLLPAVQRGNGWLFRAKVTLRKVRGDIGDQAEYTQWQDILAMIVQSGQSSKFAEPWVVTSDDRAIPQTTVTTPVQTPTTELAVAPANPTPVDPETPTETTLAETISGINSMLGQYGIAGIADIKPFGPAKKWQDLYVPDELLGLESDKFLATHEAWQNLYGVNPQIRIILSNIKRAQETDGESRNHAVLYGHAGCGKTTTMFALEKMFGTGSVLKLDATSTTKAGLEKLFFDELNEVPPLVFMEEAEKADPEALKIWLGALDDRGEIRKINFKVNKWRAIKVLFICSVNNKSVFDKMMGSDGSEAGALSSRCVTQVYYPRPSSNVLHQILDKEIKAHGGKEEWIAPCIEMAEEMGVSDPRIVRSYLAGGDRLLGDRLYQRDWKAIYAAQKNFNKPVPAGM